MKSKYLVVLALLSVGASAVCGAQSITLAQAVPNDSAMAASFSESESLTLRDAVARALRANPDLKSFDFDLLAQDGRIAQAGVAPNPELVIDQICATNPALQSGEG